MLSKAFPLRGHLQHSRTFWFAGGLFSQSAALIGATLIMCEALQVFPSAHRR
jgi:hypothetical protein